MVLGVVVQVLDVDAGQAGDEQLEFLLVEDRDQPLRDDLVEAFQECAGTERAILRRVRKNE